MPGPRDAFDDEVKTEGAEGYAPARDRRQLVVVIEGAATSHPLPASGSVLVGRAAECDVRIASTSISRRHARLDVGAAVTITDLGSANGVRVRGRKLDAGEVVAVRAGESIELGAALLVLQEPRAADVARAAAGPNAVVVADAAMARVYDLVATIRDSTISVLLLGETGVGKEVVAEAIHRASSRADRPYLQLNCAALASSLLESELFGHEKGAFTGADQTKPGLLESAHGGTVFLDEVGELPPATQVKLLRVLEDRRVQRIGSLRPREIDVRFVAATNRDLRDEAERGAFRRDLYFRLNGLAIAIPPLRERVGEIAPLARLFVAQASARLHRAPPELAPGVGERLAGYAWPGNVRELRNAMDRAVAVCGAGPIELAHLPSELSGTPRRSTPPGDEPSRLRTELRDVERQRIIEALAACGGNQTRAAELLGVSRRTLVSRLSAYGIPRPLKRTDDEP